MSSSSYRLNGGPEQQRRPVGGLKIQGGIFSSSNNNEAPVTQKRWSNSLKPSSAVGTKRERRAALGEVSNTVKPRNGNNGASNSLKPKPSVSVAQPLAQTQSRLSSSISGQPRKSLAPTHSRGSSGSSSSSNGLGLKTKPCSTSSSSSISLFQEPEVEVSTKPNVLVHTDPEQNREIREISDLGLVSNKGFYLPTQILDTDGDIEDRDENYPEPEQMGHSDEYYSMTPLSVDWADRELMDSVIRGDLDQDFPQPQILENECMMTIAEELEISLSDLSLLDSDSEEEEDVGDDHEVSEGANVSQ